MWDDPALKCWNWEISEGLLESLGSESDESPLWSPNSSSASTESDLWSPDIWSHSRYFSFEVDLFPQGIQSSISGHELWNNAEQIKNLRTTEMAVVQTENQVAPERQLWTRNTIPETNDGCHSQASQDGSSESLLTGKTCSDSDDEDNEGFSTSWSPAASQHKQESLSSSGDEEMLEMRCMWIDCKIVFNNQNSLVRHIDRFHVEGRKDDFRCFWHGCSRKNRPFNARYKLLIHMRVHTGHKPNQCNIDGCGKAFSRLENLKIHIRSHTGERPYVCHRCPKAFSNSSDRAKHQRTHIESKPYHCLFPGCNKKYTDPSSLRKHAKIHFLPNIFVKDVNPCKSQSLRPSSSARKSRKSSQPNPPLPIFSTIRESIFHAKISKIESIEFMDVNFDPFLEPKFESIDEGLLSDTHWMESGELKDIDQILSF